MSKKKANSPCIDICKMDNNTGLCKGCLRTGREINGWEKFAKSKRRAVIEAIELRKALPNPA